MKRLLIPLAMAGLVAFAIGARADPIDDFEPEIDVLGAPVGGDSWSQTFVVKQQDKPPSPDDPYVNLGQAYSAIQARINSGGQLFETTSDHDAIDNFLTYGDPPWDANPTSWDQVCSDGTYLLARGSTPTPDNKKGLQFDVWFDGDATKPPVSLSIQVYGKNNTGKDVLRRTYDFSWDGSAWTRSDGTWTQAGVIPEPLSMAFLGCAFVGVVGVRLRRRRKEERN